MRVTLKPHFGLIYFYLFAPSPNAMQHKIKPKTFALIKHKTKQ